MLRVIAMKGATAYEAQVQTRRGGFAVRLALPRFAGYGELFKLYRTTPEGDVGPTVFTINWRGRRS